MAFSKSTGANLDSSVTPTPASPAPPKYADERAAPTRPTGISVSQGNVSSRLKSVWELRHVAGRFAWPEGTTLYLPTNNGGALDDYSPKVVVYQHSLEYGLRFPLHPFIKVLLETLNISIAQVHPNAWRRIVAYVVLCSEHGVNPSLQTFWASNRTAGADKHVSLSAHGGCRMVNLEWKVNDWKYKWFLVEPPAGRCVGCPTSPQRNPRLKFRREVLDGEARKFIELVSSLSEKEWCWKRYDDGDRLMRAGIGFCQERMEFPFVNSIEESPSPFTTQGKKRNAAEGDSVTISKKKQVISCNSDSSCGEIILSSDSEAKSYCNPADSSYMEVIQTSDCGEGLEEVASPASAPPHRCSGGTEQAPEAGRVAEEGRTEPDEDGSGQGNETNYHDSPPKSMLKEALDLETKLRALKNEHLRILRDYVVKAGEEFRDEKTTINCIFDLLKTSLKENEKLELDLKELQSSRNMQLKNLKEENQLLTQEVERLKQEEKSHAKYMEIIDQIKKDNTELKQQVDGLKIESTRYQNKFSKANETITYLTKKKDELNHESYSWRIKMIRADQRAAELSKETELRATHHAQLVTRCQALEDEVSALNVEVESEAQKRNELEKARKEAEFRARKSEAKFKLALAPVVRQVAEQGIAQFKDFQTAQNKELASGFVLDPCLIKIPTELVNPDPALLDGIGGTPAARSRKVSNSLAAPLVKEDPGPR